MTRRHVIEYGVTALAIGAIAVSTIVFFVRGGGTINGLANGMSPPAARLNWLRTALKEETFVGSFQIPNRNAVALLRIAKSSDDLGERPLSAELRIAYLDGFDGPSSADDLLGFAGAASGNGDLAGFRLNRIEPRGAENVWLADPNILVAEGRGGSLLVHGLRTDRPIEFKQGDEATTGARSGVSANSRCASHL